MNKYKSIIEVKPGKMTFPIINEIEILILKYGGYIKKIEQLKAKKNIEGFNEATLIAIDYESNKIIADILEIYDKGCKRNDNILQIITIKKDYNEEEF